VTNEDILEVKKLIASMRDDLNVIAGTTDVEKLIALVLEKVPRMLDNKIMIGLSNLIDYSALEELSVILTYAQMAQSRPEFKPKLVLTVTRKMPIVDAFWDRIDLAMLDKIAQALKEEATK
jgi:hypothetical protein